MSTFPFISGNRQRLERRFGGWMVCFQKTWIWPSCKQVFPENSFQPTGFVLLFLLFCPIIAPCFPRLIDCYVPMYQHTLKAWSHLTEHIFVAEPFNFKEFVPNIIIQPWFTCALAEARTFLKTPSLKMNLSSLSPALFRYLFWCCHFCISQWMLR